MKHVNRIVSLLIVATLFIGQAWAGRVNQEDASLVANHFMNAASATSGVKKAVSPKRMVLKKAAAAEEALYYVYENADGEGWVIVAANDAVTPILAYSETGRFVTDNMPINARQWMGKYTKFIQKIEADGVEPSEEARAQWSRLRKGVNSTKATVVVGPLIKTAWDQDEPYNLYAPGTGTAGEGSDKAYTGCVATAMAQVMNYWQWPVQGNGSHTYQPEMDLYDDDGNYTETIVIYEGELTVNFGETTYDWANMKKKHSTSDTKAQKEAIGTLMYHCGVSVDMQFGGYEYDGSGALTINWGSTTDPCAQNAFPTYFRYKKDGLTSYYRDGYSQGGKQYYKKWSDADWTAMVKAELDKNHPIMYDGSGSGGHSFICDGYNDQDYFHFNWGWSGSNDGYFLLSKLKPGSGGAGGGSYDFSNTQGVIIGIVPDKPDLPDQEVTWMANGEQFTKNTATAGVVALPATQPDACVNGRVFVGWTATENYENESVAPTYIKGGEVIEAATTYYAVYATAEESGEAAFDGNNGGKFKFYSQKGDVKYYATATINSSNKLESSTNEADAAEFTFTKVDGGFTIKADKYLAYSGSKTNVGWSDDAYVWTISASESGCGAWRAIASTVNTRCLAISITDSYQSFGAYATSNINCTQYFDLEIGGGSGASYKDYSTSCGSAEPCALTGITLNTDKVAKEFKTGDAFSYEGLIVTAKYSNCSNRTVTPKSVSTPDMSVAGKKTVTVTYEENEVSKEASYEITVSDPATYTISFYNNGELIGEAQNVIEGQSPEVPADPKAECEGYTFYGWYTETIAKDNTNKPAKVEDFKAVKDQNYYAVFSKTEAGEGGEKAFDGETEGKYKIYGLAGETKYYATAHVNTSFKIDATTDEAEAAEFTLEKVEGGFTIKTGEKYLAYSGSGTNVDLEPDAFTWSIGASEAGRGTWRAIAGTYTTRAFALRVNTNFQSFGGYATSNIKANSEYYDLEIVGGASSTTYYSTVVSCEETGVKNVESDKVQCTKVLRDGKLYILYNGIMYNVQGARIK